MHINVAYACDNGYIMQTGISMLSLLENNKEIDSLTVYLVSKGISNDNIRELKDLCVRYGRDLVVIDFDEIAYDLNISAIGRHIATIYAKIFFERIPNVEKLFYIDSDTIVNESLADLWRIDLTGYYMGMVQTFTGGEAKIRLGLTENNPFYNDGVALVNVKYSREHHLLKQCKQVISDYDGNPPVLSEGVINKVCVGHIKSISPRYNMMAGVYQLITSDVKYASTRLNYSMEDLTESVQRPVVIHFLSGFYNRPWSRHCTHPLKHIFLEYKKMSPWQETPLTDSRLPLKLRLLGCFYNLVGAKTFFKIINLIR